MMKIKTEYSEWISVSDPKTDSYKLFGFTYKGSFYCHSTYIDEISKGDSIKKNLVFGAIGLLGGPVGFFASLAVANLFVAKKRTYSTHLPKEGYYETSKNFFYALIQSPEMLEKEPLLTGSIIFTNDPSRCQND